jgi:hypothetical protein
MRKKPLARSVRERYEQVHSQRLRFNCFASHDYCHRAWTTNICGRPQSEAAYDAISDYIDNYYNPKRRHSAAENLSPINFELAHAGQLAA